MAEIEFSNEKILQAWKQRAIPIVLRRNGKGEKLRIRIPPNDDNQDWLRNGRRRIPVWIDSKQYWELPKAWFNDFVNRSLKHYGRLYVVQPYNEQEKCASACMNATGHECECSCMGAYHGTGNDGSWFEVSDAFATRWGGRHLACRLMIARQLV